MGFLHDLLVSDAGIAFILKVLGLIVTAFLSSEFWKRIQSQRDAAQQAKNTALVNKAYAMLEAVVHSKFEQAEQLKAAHGGKLTDEDRNTLKEAVIADLKNMAREIGFDAVDVIGSQFIGVAITYVVRRLKGGADAAPLSTAVQNLFPN